MVEGMPYDEQVEPSNNPYLNLESKRFKRTGDIGEAVQQLPELVTKAFEASNGNIEVLQNKLRALKQNTYETMPNPDRIPISFFRYLNFISNTRGPEEAANRMMDYMRQNAINRAKSSLVPTF